MDNVKQGNRSFRSGGEGGERTRLLQVDWGEELYRFALKRLAIRDIKPEEITGRCDKSYLDALIIVITGGSSLKSQSSRVI